MLVEAGSDPARLRDPEFRQMITEKLTAAQRAQWAMWRASARLTTTSDWAAAWLATLNAGAEPIEKMAAANAKRLSRRRRRSR